MERIIVYEKVTTWIKHIIGVEDPDDYGKVLNKVIECYANNKDPMYEEGINILDSEELSETMEPLTVVENGGCATIEIEDRDSDIIWDNAKVC